VALDIQIALEAIQGEAPTKEPSARAGVGFRDDRNVDPDVANDAIEQAFDEGYARAMWEVSQKLDAIIPTLGALVKRFEPSWDNPDGPTAA